MEDWLPRNKGNMNISCSLTKPTDQSKVEIDPAMQRDAGYYECQAYNKHAVETKATFKSRLH